MPTEFVYFSEHADAPLRIQNAIYNYSTGFLWSLSDQEGGVGLPFRTAEDPRVPFEDPEDVGLDGSTDQFILLKYEQPSTNVPVADGIEARLIEAEAALQAQDLGGMNTASSMACGPCRGSTRSPRRDRSTKGWTSSSASGRSGSSPPATASAISAACSVSTVGTRWTSSPAETTSRVARTAPT